MIEPSGRWSASARQKDAPWDSTSGRASQSGNSIGAAERKLTAEGVRENCELVTGDMRAMPFPDVSFDLVVSSLVIHSIRDPTPPITWCSFMAAALSMRS